MIGTLVLGAVSPILAAELILQWEYPADDTPAPASFLVSYLSSTNPTTPQQFRLPHLGRASCEGVQSLAALTADTVCGRPPDCLAPGIYLCSVQAERGEERSPESNIATCEALPGCAYTCEGVSLPPALQQLRQDVQGGTPPSPEATLQAVTSIANTPTPPTTPSVTTAAPTIAQVTDQVQAALNQLPKAPV